MARTRRPELAVVLNRRLISFSSRPFSNSKRMWLPAVPVVAQQKVSQMIRTGEVAARRNALNR